MIPVSGKKVEDDILTARFACDLDRCKGACCTMPGSYGAPLLDEELYEIERHFPRVKNLLPVEHLQVIERQGFWSGGPGLYFTTVVRNRACVFVYYDETGIARCAYERRFIDGVIPWQKPVSCHLFPIRVSRGDQDHLRYEQIPECLPGVAKGEREQIPLVEFLRTSLERAFGLPWWQALVQWKRK